MRRCEYCDRVLDEDKPNAKYCSRKHKNKARESRSFRAALGDRLDLCPTKWKPGYSTYEEASYKRGYTERAYRCKCGLLHPTTRTGGNTKDVVLVVGRNQRNREKAMKDGAL